MKTKLRDLLLLLFALPVVLLIRISRPFIIIRLGPLYNRRIGHFAINTELYLCERDSGAYKGRYYDIFYYGPGKISNYQLKRMWERMLRIFMFSRLAYLVDRVNRCLPGYQTHVIPMPMSKCRDIDGFLGRTAAHLSFSPQEESAGRSALADMGICEDAAFICFHVRDSAYLDAVYPSYDWRYHGHRDSGVNNYVAAVKELARRGYFVLRMGAIVKEPLNVSEEKIIDYARRYRTDFLDIYLSAKCRFFIASNSGIDEIPKIFRRPVLYVNFIPLGLVHTWSPILVFIPKKLWLRSQGRFLTFREMLDMEEGRPDKEKYEKLGLDIVDNTPEEITAACIEMDERLKGIWQASDEDESLQRRFRSLFRPNGLHGKITARLGAEFLRQNRQLLE